MSDPRMSLRRAPHMAALADFVDKLRDRGLAVPDLDPNDGGINARAMFPLESPGPKAVTSRYVSSDNPDPSAANMKRLCVEAGFQRSDVVLWNVVPQCISTREKNRNASSKDIRAALPDTQAFIELFPRLRTVVLCGRRAQRVELDLKLAEGVALLKTFHPGAMSYNRPANRLHMQEAFSQAAHIACS